MQRETGKCPVYKKCSGCQLRNMTYDEQLGYKERKVIGILGKFCHVEPIIEMAEPYHYRNKVQAAFGKTRGGKIISGVYGSKDRCITVIDSCLINDKKADEIVVTIRKLLNSFKMEPYDEYSGRGMLRHVLIRKGFSTGQILVVLVCATPLFPSKNKFISALLSKHPEITTVIHNVNRDGLNLTLGKNSTVLYGKEYIEDRLCGFTFRITAGSFYQINPLQTEALYNSAIEMAELTGKEFVLDAYCGIGTIGIALSKYVKKVIGVEINGEAVKNAIYNAKFNDIKNIRFYKGDAGEYMQEMCKNGENPDVVFMDPPRAGSSRKFLSSLAETAPDKVVYISCNPDTQKRDIEFLIRNGYKVKKIQPVDMFPHTDHIETIVLLKRKSSFYINDNIPRRKM